MSRVEPTYVVVERIIKQEESIKEKREHDRTRSTIYTAMYASLSQRRSHDQAIKWVLNPQHHVSEAFYLIELRWHNCSL